MDTPPTNQLQQTEAKLQQLERRLTLRFEAARTLSQTESLSEAAPKLLRVICEGLNWDVGQLWVVDRQVNKLRCVPSWSCDSRDVDHFVAATRNRFSRHRADLPDRI